MSDDGLKSGIKDELLKFKKKRYAIHQKNWQMIWTILILDQMTRYMLLSFLLKTDVKWTGCMGNHLRTLNVKYHWTSGEFTIILPSVWFQHSPKPRSGHHADNSKKNPLPLVQGGTLWYIEKSFSQLTLLIWAR